MLTLSVAIVGCNNDTKTYTSEELAQNLQLIKNNKMILKVKQSLLTIMIAY